MCCKNDILCTFMSVIENGGAHAIKGFNYQKSVIVLISVLHYLSEDDFEIYVEAKDDIVVKLEATETYIQVKGKKMSIGELTKKPDGKDSIIEKNHANGGDGSFYKVISPEFANNKKYLKKTTPRIFKKGADVFDYTKDATDEIIDKLPKISKAKLSNSKIVLTKFQANIEDALTYIKGIMVGQDIQVDNNHGMASLQELCLRIDQSSERVSKNTSDLEKKKFTSKDLSTIFSHTYKAKCFDDVLAKLNYSTAKQEMIKNKRVAVAAIYKSFYNDAKRELEKLDLIEMKESDVLEKVLNSVNFDGVIDEIIKIAIVLDAYSQIVFDRRIKL